MTNNIRSALLATGWLSFGWIGFFMGDWVITFGSDAVSLLFAVISIKESISDIKAMKNGS